MSAHDHATPAAPLHPPPHTHTPAGPSAARAARHVHGTRPGQRPLPALNLLGVSTGARLGLAAGALVLLWATILWALH